MCNQKLRIKFISGFLFALLLFLCSQELFAKPKLKLNGSIVAYAIAPEEWQGSILGITSILIVKVSKVVKGRETSKFIIVRFTGKKSNYFDSEFTKEKTFKLNLERTDYCDASIESLLYANTFDEKEVVTKVRSSLTFVSGINESIIPAELKMPCYFISSKKS
jgi:hypothetical protein